MDFKYDISVIISLFNEAESLPELYSWIRSSLDGRFRYELIFVDDGSTDSSWDIVSSFASDADEKAPAVHGIRFRRNYGKSAALYAGFNAAKGRVVVTMDADLQDSPEEIPAMYDMVANQGWDIVSGWKQQRKDNKLTKNLPSKLYNATARRVTGIQLHDMNCGLKAYRNQVVKAIEVYGDMHRYIPYLAKNAGYSRITEIPVHHQKRKYGSSKFGMDRFVHGLLDLMSLWFLGKFSKKPMHFFGATGLLSFFAGAVMTVWVIAQKLILQGHGLKYRAVTDQPLFYLALTMLVTGVIMFCTGFICEMISRSSGERNNYNIREEF